MKFADKMLDLLYPKGLTCNVCKKELKDNERKYSFCGECLKSFRKVENTTTINGKTKVFSCFYYEGAVRKTVLSYKDSNKPYISEYMAKYMADLYLSEKLKCDVIMYVPSNKKTIMKRGYDAMGEVAQYLSKEIDLPILNILRKRENVADLAALKGDERRNAVRDAFSCEFHPDLMKKRILFIDDVFTTGATVGECCTLLYRCGAKNIKIITFSKARA